MRLCNRIRLLGSTNCSRVQHSHPIKLLTTKMELCLFLYHHGNLLYRLKSQLLVICTLWFSKCLKWHGLFIERFIPFFIAQKMGGQNSVWSHQEWKQLHHNIVVYILRHISIIEISHHWFRFFTYLTISHFLNQCRLTVYWALGNIASFEGLIQK